MAASSTSRRRKATASKTDQAAESSGLQRLQKVLAAAGVASRRQCELLIEEGRVEVDRQVVDQLGARVDPNRQEIRVDGEKVVLQRRLYYLVNKPPGVVSTNFDPQRRLRVIDFVDSQQRLFTIGRLDKSSEGLILVTNDGQLANRLAHPRYEVEKTYLVEVAGEPDREQLLQLTRGVYLAEGIARIASYRIKRRFKQSTQLEIVLKEGRNREIRRLLARLGHKVLRLKRVALGPIKLGELPSGAHRELTSRELQALRRLAGEQPTGGKKSHKKPASKRPPGKRTTGKQSPAGRPSAVKKKGNGVIKKKGPAKRKRPVKGKRTVKGRR